MSARPYASVVFSAYVVPTVPLVDAQVGDPDGPGYVDGKYVGIQGDPEMDIRIRVKLLSAAVEQAWDMCQDTRDDPSVLHILMVPEFFFRGQGGAYTSDSYSKIGRYVASLLREVANAPKLVHWLFLFGTVLESNAASSTSELTDKKATVRGDLCKALAKAWDACPVGESKDFVFDLLTRATDFAQSHPLFLVQNRCFAYKQNCEEWPLGLAVEKQYLSHEDFVISYYSPGVYSEANVAYPHINETQGEIKEQSDDNRSIFQMDGITFAIEICLDHRHGRLRGAIDKQVDGPRPSVDVQLVPSCGMQVSSSETNQSFLVLCLVDLSFTVGVAFSFLQIQQPPVVAREGGLVFNCDGQYGDYVKTDLPDNKTSIFTGSADGKGHSQLCVVTKSTWTNIGQDAQVSQPQGVSVVTAPLCPPSDVNVTEVEAYGAGEVHVYSKCALP